MSAENDPISYKPSAWYYRDGMRSAADRKEVQELLEIGLQAVMEIENLRAFIRERGIIPPKDFVLEAEARDKGWEVQDELRFTS